MYKAGLRVGHGVHEESADEEMVLQQVLEASLKSSVTPPHPPIQFRTRGYSGNHDVEFDEDLRKAIEESLRN